MSEDGRVPPQATEAESWVLGGILLEPSSIPLLDLQPDDFYRPAHRHICEAVFDLQEKNSPVDVRSVELWLRDRQLLDVVGGPDYLADLTKSPSGANIEHHSMVVKEKAMLRRAIIGCNDIIKMSYGNADPFTVVDDLYELALQLDRSGSKNSSLTPEEIFERDKNNPQKPKLYTGIKSLDEGLFKNTNRRGHVHLTISDSGHGKTTWAEFLAKRFLLQGYNVAWFQLEGTDSETAESIRITVPPDATGKIYINSKLEDIEDIKREGRRLNEDVGIDYAVFDYVQNIEANKQNRTDEVEYISRSITKLAKHCDMLVHPLSQVTMNYNTRAGWSQEPGYGDVRWSQQLKQDADIITTLFRPAKVESLILSPEETVENWRGDAVPYDSVFVRQAKHRHARQSWKRQHLIHTDSGLQLYAYNHDRPQTEKSHAGGDTSTGFLPYKDDDNDEAPF